MTAATLPFEPLWVPGGQPGILDRRVLEQDRWWADRAGRCHLLDEMSPHHRANVLRMLHADRRSLHLGAAVAAVLPDTATEARTLLADAAAGRAVHQQAADTWFCAQPLVTRLRQLCGPVDLSDLDEVGSAQAARQSAPAVLVLGAARREHLAHLASLGLDEREVAVFVRVTDDVCQLVLRTG